MSRFSRIILIWFGFLSLNLYAQVGFSEQLDSRLIDKSQTIYSHVQVNGKNHVGTYIFKNGSILNYSRDFSDHPGLFAQEFVPGDYYDLNDYQNILSQFMKLILDKVDYDAAKRLLKVDKFTNYMEFNLDVPGYAEFIINVRIDPHGVNMFISYYSAA